MKSSYLSGLLGAASLACLALTSCGMQSVAVGERGTSAGLLAILDQASSSGTQNASLNIDAAGLLRATGLAGAKYIYGTVKYNPAQQHFTGSSAPESADSLVIALDDSAAGLVHVGWVQSNFDRKGGVSGDLVLMSLSFADGPSMPLRTVSGPPVGEANAVTLTADTAVDNEPVLLWNEEHSGDGNNDGVISVQDLTPIGLFFQQDTQPSDTDAKRDADYNKDGKVTVQDLTPIGLNFQDRLAGYAIFAGPDGSSLVEIDRVDRADEFSGTVPQGVLEWDFQPPTITADTVYRVQPFDNTGALGELSNTVSVDFVQTIPEIVQIVDITFPGSDTWLKQGGDFTVILTELSVDDVDDNAEAIDILVEDLQLQANVLVQGNAVPQDGTEDVQWVLTGGGGLADLSNAAGSKGQVSFNDRGRVEITAHLTGNFAEAATITFRLFTIDSLGLELAGGGTGPTNVAAGTDVAFTATGTFDWDSIDNGDELDRDLTGFCNWGLLPGGTNTGTFSFNTGSGTLITDDAASADLARIFAEFPGTPEVTLFDNLRRSSDLIDVNIN
jgi:hypothetical protein